MLHFYLVTTPLYLKEKMFKYGYWSGSRNGLRDRYITALPQVIIYFFLVTPRAKELENLIRQKFDGTRIIGEGNRKSEWIICDADYLIQQIQSFITHLECFFIPE